MGFQVFLPGTIAGAASCPAEDKAILDPRNSPQLTIAAGSSSALFVLRLPHQTQLKDMKPCNSTTRTHSTSKPWAPPFWVHIVL